MTPSLRERLEDSPGELHELLEYIARSVAGEDEAEQVAAEVGAWVGRHLGADYAWPGNVRELEQCVRNVLIHRTYHPPKGPSKDVREALAEAVCSGRLSAEDLLRHYCTLVYADAGTYQAAARRLGLDHRTVKAKTPNSQSPEPVNGSPTTKVLPHISGQGSHVSPGRTDCVDCDIWMGYVNHFEGGDGHNPCLNGNRQTPSRQLVETHTLVLKSGDRWGDLPIPPAES